MTEFNQQTNKNVLLSYHGVHSDHPQDFRRGMAVTGLKIVSVLAAAWLLVTLLFVLGD